MNLFEEINFFKNTQENIYLPILLTLLNLPSILFEIFPFIFLISAVFFFINLLDSREIEVFRQYGIDNLKILTTLSFSSLFIGLFMITIFYYFSSNLKFKYYDIKNDFTKDDKYLAVITSNGLWIRDEVGKKIYLINSSKISGDYLLNLNISEFDKNFEINKIITSKKAHIKTNNWLLYEVNINSKNNRQQLKNLNFKSNFDINKLLSMFDSLSASNLFEINKLKKDYEILGYSTYQIDNYRHKIFSYPIYLTLMLLIGSILMLNVKHNKSKIFYIILAILISVIIYYIDFFTKSISIARNISYIFSVWGLLILYSLIISVNLIKINEK